MWVTVCIEVFTVSGEIMYEKLDVFDCVQLLTVPGEIMCEKLDVGNCIY